MNNFILRDTSMIQGGTEIVRRDALRKIGGHDVNLTFYGDDADLARRLSKVGEVRFSFAFAMRSSGRRLAKEGTFTMGLRYALNYFWITLFNKPFTMTSTEVRFADEKMTYQPESSAKEWTIALGAIVVIFAIIEGAYLRLLPLPLIIRTLWILGNKLKVFPLFRGRRGRALRRAFYHAPHPLWRRFLRASFWMPTPSRSPSFSFCGSSSSISRDSTTCAACAITLIS